MMVQNINNFISLSDEFRYELFTREEALQLLEDLTEAIRLLDARRNMNEVKE